MRILITTFFPRAIEIEGVGRVVTSLASSFSRLGHDVTVVAPLRSEGTTRFRCCNYMASSDSKSVWGNYAAYRRTAAAEARACDRIFAVEISPSFLMSSSFLVKHHPQLHIISMGVFLDRTIFASDQVTIQNLYHYVLKNGFWKHFFPVKQARFIVATAFQRHQLIAAGVPDENIHVIPYGIDSDQFRRFARGEMKQKFHLNGQKVISYIGHFSPVKGVPNLLLAYAELLKSDRDLKCAIAWSGKGLESKRVLELMQRLNLRDRVALFGTVNVAQFLSAVDLLVLPFTNSSIPHYPLLILEAFAMGVPVVTTDVGGLSELIRNEQTGVLVKPNSPVDLANGIKQLLANEGLRDHISRNQRAIYARRFNSLEISKEYAELGTN